MIVSFGEKYDLLDLVVTTDSLDTTFLERIAKDEVLIYEE